VGGSTVRRLNKRKRKSTGLKGAGKKGTLNQVEVGNTAWWVLWAREDSMATKDGKGMSSVNF